VVSLQVGIQATLEQLRAYKARFPMAKFELPENIYTDDFDMTQFEKVRPMNNDFAEICSGSEEGSYLRPKDVCINQL
jgi:hypothetical protein